MLNKEICIKCILKGMGYDELQEPLYWTINEVIWCVGTGYNTSIKLDTNNDEPPEDCPYRMEHLVLNQKEILNEA